MKTCDSKICNQPTQTFSRVAPVYTRKVCDVA
jgi:hypothetical protein